MVPVEQKQWIFLLKITASNECSNSGNHNKGNNFLERRTVHSIWMSTCLICSIVLHTKLLSHDLDAFCCVRLLSHDAKSVLNVATFLKMAVHEVWNITK